MKMKNAVLALSILGLVSCADHPYETDGHMEVRLPEMEDERQEEKRDSVSIDKTH